MCRQVLSGSDAHPDEFDHSLPFHHQIDRSKWIFPSGKIPGANAVAGSDGQPGARVPGSKRLAAYEKADRDGVPVNEDLIARIEAFVA